MTHPVFRGDIAPRQHTQVLPTWVDPLEKIPQRLAAAPG